LHAFRDVISAESAEITMKHISRREIKLLSSSKSIHMLEKVEIDPNLLMSGSPLDQAINQATFPRKEDTENEDSPRNPLSENSFTVKKGAEGDPVKFVEYAPRLFYNLRKNDGITCEFLQNSFEPIPNRSAAFKAGESQGKSGSFFFFTFDKKFLIKTMNLREYKTFMNFLPTYYSYCIQHKNSLIARIYGIFKLQLPGLVPLYFFLMENAVKYEDKQLLRGIFDLKGSQVNRLVDENGKIVTDTLKDMNFLNRLKNEQVFL